MRVLIAEDEPVLLWLTSEALTEAGHDVLVAEDGHKAMELLNQEPGLGALVTDVNMPGPDGISVARHARTINPDMLVIVVSGRDHRSAIGAFGARSHYLQKPFRLNDLVDFITSGEPTAPDSRG